MERSQTVETFSQAPKLPGTEKANFLRSVKAKQLGCFVLVFTWLLYHREDSNHFSTPLLVRAPTEAM